MCLRPSLTYAQQGTENQKWREPADATAGRAAHRSPSSRGEGGTQQHQPPRVRNADSAANHQAEASQLGYHGDPTQSPRASDPSSSLHTFILVSTNGRSTQGFSKISLGSRALSQRAPLASAMQTRMALVKIPDCLPDAPTFFLAADPVAEWIRHHFSNGVALWVAPNGIT